MSLPKQKFLIALTGLVGSGKTYIARIIARHLKAVHVRTDDIRIALSRQGKSWDGAVDIAEKRMEESLTHGRSVVMDFDAVRRQRQKTLRQKAQKYNARFFLVKIMTSEKIIIERLKNHRYTKKDIFRSAEDAIKIYFIRKKFHAKLRRRQGSTRADFTIDNAKTIEPQINKIIKKIKGL